MNRRIYASFTGCILVLAVAGCNKETTTPGSAAGQDAPGATMASAPPEAMGGTFAGKVIETMNSGGYTYVQVDTGKERIWAAAPPFKVQVGDAVTVPPGVPMQNFHSSTLDRDFAVIHFVNSIGVGGAPDAALDATQLPAGHPPIPGATSAPAVDFSGLQKVDGGYTVAEVFAGKNELKGKQVKVRGKVVKFNANIMGKNWLHLRDGTGESGANDLTVTTTAEPKVGDTVVVTGALAIDQDFGYNYQYPVLVEKAEVRVE